MRNVEAMQICK